MSLIIDNELKMMTERYEAGLQKKFADPAAQMAHTLALHELAVMRQIYSNHQMGQQDRLGAKRVTVLNDEHAEAHRKTFNKGALGQTLTAGVPVTLSAASVVFGFAGSNVGTVASQAASTLNSVFGPLFENQFKRAEEQHELDKGQQLVQSLNQDKSSHSDQTQRGMQGLDSAEEKRHRAMET